MYAVYVEVLVFQKVSAAVINKSKTVLMFVVEQKQLMNVILAVEMDHFQVNVIVLVMS